MGFEYIQTIPQPEEIIAQIPLDRSLKEIKRKRDEELRAIFEGRIEKFVLIIGPCSADNEEPVCEYVSRLAEMQEKVKDKIFIVPRIYTNKPRTTGEGYKGMLHQPDPGKAPNIAEGIAAIRRMHIRAIRESHLVAADEMLYPENLEYVQDMLTYIAVGARSVENQQHRLVSSGIDIPVGMKNPTSGDMSVMLNSITAAQHGHTFMYQGKEVKTTGNNLAHAVVRGSVNKHGQSIPNYHYEDLNTLVEQYLERGLVNPVIVVDVNHSNSRKTYWEQPRIVKEILRSRQYNSELQKMLKAAMIESYLEEGSVKPGENTYGKSITDACIGWEETRRLIEYIAEHV